MDVLKKVIGFYDASLVRMLGWHRVPGSSIGFLYMVPKVHKGKNVLIEDGTVIQRGDCYYEIHMVNTNLKNLDTSYGNLFTMLAEELKSIGIHMEKPENRKYKAVLGITLLHRLARRAGFTIIEIESPVRRKLVSLGENILRSTLRKEKAKKDGKKRVAKECWISQSQLFEMIRD